MRVLMIAPPGAGKGTQSELIAAHFGIPHIATGKLLRDHVAGGPAWAWRCRSISTAVNSSPIRSGSRSAAKSSRPWTSCIRLWTGYASGRGAPLT
jgi:Adenylate kinase